METNSSSSPEADPLPEMHFIISAPRSGSTWLAKALNGHPEIFATENRLFGEFCEIWPNSDGSMSPRITFDEFLKQFSTYFMFEEIGLKRRQFVERFQRGFLSFLMNFCQRQSGKRVMVDKITPYLNSTGLVLDRIRQYFPAAKTLQLIRDGRDVVTSGTFDWILKDSQGTDRFSFFVEKRPGLHMKRFFDDKVLQRWVGLWKEPIEAYPEVNDGMIIRYEEMKDNQADLLLRIFEYLGCSSTEPIIKSCIERATFEKMSGRKVGDEGQPLAKTRKGISGDWKNYFTKRDGILFNELAGHLLVELGYEQDQTWINSLPDELDYFCD
ncbi:MAG: sulfotransferase domain-containing protein [Planctomycetota bacterium]|nr:sulfotransferase domain-containing protein [Planctomycetota bacterium]